MSRFSPFARRVLAGACAIACLAALAPRAAAQAARAAQTPSTWERINEQFLADKLEIGLRFTYFSLVDDEKNNYDKNGNFVDGFLGSINKLDAEQTFMPYPFLRYYPIPYVGIELGYDKMRAKTKKYYDDDDDSDGSIDMKGPSIALLGRYPNETTLTPYGGVGVVFYNCDFEYDGYWHHGFRNSADYNAWRAQGSPEWPNNGYERNIKLSDTTAWYITGGASWEIVEHIALDFQLRYMWADVDAHYYLSFYGNKFDDRGNFNFPMENWAGQLSVKYSF